MGRKKNSQDAELTADIRIQDIVNGRHESAVYIVFFCIITLQMILHFLYGFRWPSEYVQSCTVFNYGDGFLIRGFIGSCLRVLFRDLVYDKLFLSLFILVVGLLVLALFIFVTYYFTVRKHDLLGSVLMLWYALSIYSAYLAHEMGYFEQYGYVVIFAVILFLSEIKNRKALMLITAVLMFILLLVSETNAFLIWPVLLSVCLIRVITDAWAERHSPKREILFLFFVNIPNAAYCVLTKFFGASEEQIAAQIEKAQEHCDLFVGLKPIGAALVSGARTSSDYVRQIKFSLNPWQLMAYVLLIMFTVGLALVLLGRVREMLLFVGTSGFVVISAYIMCVFGWDIERWRFAQAMGVTLLAIWQVRRIDTDKIVWKKDMVYTLVIGTILMLSIMNYQLKLFDECTYNTSIKKLVEVFTNFKALQAH